MGDFIIDVQGFVFKGRPMILKAVNVLECGADRDRQMHGFVLFPHKPESELTPTEVATVRWAEHYHGYLFIGGFCSLDHVRRRIRRLIPAGSRVYVNGDLKARVLETTFGFARRNVSMWTTHLFTTKPAFVDSWKIVAELKHRYDHERAASFRPHDTCIRKELK